MTTRLVHTRDELRGAMANRSGEVGVVMTMGALHDGHRELIKVARRRCKVIVPQEVRAEPAPTPQRIAASAAAWRTFGWSASPSAFPEHSSSTGRPSSTTRGPCGPETIRMR